MDEADDICRSWPHWKFDLKWDDLPGFLHDRYNTIPTPIQDPEAFHHDVFEISHQASSTEEFYRLLDQRKQQRVTELNRSLESAAFEIIANPALIGTDQWQHAVQLFRTKSLDSLVRYFASYLPHDHPWKPTSSASSVSESPSSVDSLVHSHGSSAFFDDYEDDGLMTDEPLDIPESAYPPHLPPSPRSMTMCSDSSAADGAHHNHHHRHHHHDHKYHIDTLTPARTLSISGSEPDSFSHPHFDDEDASQPPSPMTTISDVSEADPFDVAGKQQQQQQSSIPSTTAAVAAVVAKELSSPSELTSQLAQGESVRGGGTVIPESDTPTPKPEPLSAAFFETKPSRPPRRSRSMSPYRPLSSSMAYGHDVGDDHDHDHEHDPRRSVDVEMAQSLRQRRMARGCSPVTRRSRRGRKCAGGESAGRIQKSQQVADASSGGGGVDRSSRSRPRLRRGIE